MGISLLILGFLGQLIIAISIGTWLLRRVNKKLNTAWALIVGIIIYDIIKFIPIIG
ncbi:MAG: hypothetical protein HY424_00700 [Candidatus Levybacteria bacterium]|nr:hypothetical protein [Candidatus Levybacteria bacterium]